MENRTRKVEIRSLNKNKFGGLALYPYSSGTVLVPQLTKSGFKTGLTKAEETQFEEALNLKKGELGRKSELWSTVEIRVKNKAILDLSDDWDYLKYKTLFENTRVCPSPTLTHKYANAEYVLVDEEADAKLESIEIDWEIKAFEHFVKLSEKDKKGVLRIYGVIADNANIDIINTKLHKFLKENPKRFVETLEDKNLENKIFIAELLENEILTKHRNLFKNGDDIIGNTTEEVLEYISNPKNSSIVANFKTRLAKSKKN